MEGISTDTIVKFFEEKTDNDLKNNFVGVFPSKYVIKFISFHEMLIEKGRYQFIIMNTDRSDKKGTHWWSFLELHQRKEIFLFDSFGSEGFKEFIIDIDKNVINKILVDLKKLKKKDNKVTLITLKFFMSEYEKKKRS